MTTGWWAERFVELEGIPSAEAFGNMGLGAGAVDLSLAGIPSAEAFGNMNVIGPPQDISMVGIPSAEAFGGSEVRPGAANVSLFGKASDQAFGNLTVTRGPVSVGLSSIPSQEAFGTMSVGYPISYDNSSAVGTSRVESGAFTIGADAKILLYWISCQTGSSTTDLDTTTASIDGQTMDRLPILVHSSNTSFKLVCFYKLNPPSGTNKKIVMTNFPAAACYYATGASTYKNVTAIGTPVSAQGNSISPTVIAASAPNRMVANAFMYSGAYSAYNQTRRGFKNTAAFVNQGLIWGDAPGAASVNFTHTMSSAGDWIGYAIPLIG
ncbi:minor tail protein [Mycobacterium phage Damien]|uniref:Minor tail protein n=1 Tax=Mycobacterium phage Konstantine TaxID=563121 RepID=B5U506_9CAUD|nr:minor tail protein [Mycobacterium phage Konstantine]YP_009044020.1 minor tail protein [Mycobacterium phage Damien]ACI12452.1 hypothetical protein KONSTANTINE_36 [Mycobacterium phage Konstantine]AHZ95392.1 minor tail protein [Mycobacterium phage Damien]